MNLIISQELAQAILNYLTTRPYIEVFRFIDQLQKLSPEQLDKEKDNKK